MQGVQNLYQQSQMIGAGFLKGVDPSIGRVLYRTVEYNFDFTIMNYV